MNKFFVFVVIVVLFLSTITIASGNMCFVRGDVNNDGAVDVADYFRLQSWLFSTPTPEIHPNLDALDVNDDGGINVADSIYLLNLLYYGYTWFAPNADTGDGTDRTPDNLNSSPDPWDWAATDDGGDSPGLWDPSSIHTELYAESIHPVWPKRRALPWLYNSPTVGVVYGGAFEAKTEPMSVYPRLGNDIWADVSIGIEPVPSPFNWGAFSKADCACRNTIQLQWYAILFLYGSNPATTSGTTVLEADVSNTRFTVHLKNTRSGEYTTVRAVVDVGIIGMVLKNYNGILYEDPNAPEYQGWDNDNGGQNGSSASAFRNPSGTLNFTFDDLQGTPHDDWLDSDMVVLDTIYITNGFLRHKPKAHDATLYDNVRIKIGVTQPKFAHLEE